VSGLRRFARELRVVFAGGGRRLPTLAALVAVATTLDLLGVALIAPLLALAIAQPQAAGLTADVLSSATVPALCVIVSCVYLARAALALLVQHRISAITEGERARLMVRLLAAYQAMPWEQYLQRSSPELVNRVLWYTQAACAGVLSSLLRLCVDGLVFVALVGLLFASDPGASLLLALGVAIAGALVFGVLRGAVAHALRATADANARIMEATQQALGAFREVRLLGREPAFRERLAGAGERLAHAGARHAVYAQAPRYALELALVAFVVATLWLAHGGDGADRTLPLLATFAAAGMRLLPAGTSIVANANAVRGHRFALAALADELIGACVQPAHGAGTAPAAASGFGEMALRGVSYAYPGTAEPVLRGIDLTIRRGEVVGLAGPSGAGKSTLADLMLGLLSPQQGTLRVDGSDVAADAAAWQRHCAYIPQTVYLLDDSVRRNIALGEADAAIDAARLASAIGLAQLQPVLDALPQGLDTVVGEGGCRLSGGQRQRVAIARALYHQRGFLVLDEATSALDPDTEAAVAGAIRALAGSVTMLVIAHRGATLSACGRVLRLEGGRLRDAVDPGRPGPAGVPQP
jgi:ABC-type multidrug transport system fused ATPase/permease subunit